VRSDAASGTHDADLGGSRVWVTGDVLHMSGDAEKAARAYLRSGKALGPITSVDLTAADYTDGDAVYLLLRALQNQQAHQPGTRLVVCGADDTVRYQLHVLGVLNLLELHD
jgi:anti-anti-sigma regulatory factor